MSILKSIVALLLLCMININASWAAEDDVVKVGDLVQINLPGEASLNKGFQVDKRGRISLPEIGPVFVAGYNEKQLQDVIIENLKSVYRDVNNARVSSSSSNYSYPFKAMWSNPENTLYKPALTFKCSYTKPVDSVLVRSWIKSSSSAVTRTSNSITNASLILVMTPNCRRLNLWMFSSSCLSSRW